MKKLFIILLLILFISCSFQITKNKYAVTYSNYKLLKIFIKPGKYKKGLFHKVAIYEKEFISKINNIVIPTSDNMLIKLNFKVTWEIDDLIKYHDDKIISKELGSNNMNNSIIEISARMIIPKYKKNKIENDLSKGNTISNSIILNEIHSNIVKNDKYNTSLTNSGVKIQNIECNYE